MGTYTTTQQFYKPDTTELVDVEQQINYNLRRIDERVRPLIEYQMTDVTSISASDLPKDTGFKWWKSYSNSIWHYRDGGIFQDANAANSTWSTIGLTLINSYSSYDNNFQVSYSSHNGMVRWRGKVSLSNLGNLPTNTATKFLTPPTGFSPAKERYFTVYGGNSTGDFQCFRIRIPDSSAGDKSFEFIKYGGNGSSSAENYFSLHDVVYPLSDT